MFLHCGQSTAFIHFVNEITWPFFYFSFTTGDSQLLKDVSEKVAVRDDFQGVHDGNDAPSEIGLFTVEL